MSIVAGDQCTDRQSPLPEQMIPSFAFQDLPMRNDSPPMPSRTLTFVFATFNRHRTGRHSHRLISDFPPSRNIPSYHRLKRRYRTAPSPFKPPRANPPKCLSPSPVSHQNQQVSVLPLPVIQRIASGQVITGYDSVIQELVENSIDAQATSISVDLDLSTRSITVSDNGVGISPDQGLLSVAKCNATSKLHSLQQLRDGVQTLGFRGQALWAIAHTAKSLTVSSRIQQHDHGTTLRFSNDGLPIQHSVAPTPMANGTVVTVQGLPWTYAGRQLSRTFSACKAWLFRAALCYPLISFRLTRNKQLYWVRPGGKRDPNDGRVLSLADEFKASPADFRAASVPISGLGTVDIVAAIPSMVHSPSRSSVMIAVNGRCVVIDDITAAITQCVNVKKSRYPVVFVHLSIASGAVDWNVSPIKSVARFKDPDMMAIIEKEVVAVIGDMMSGMPVPEVVTAPLESTRELPLSGRETKVLQRLVSFLPSKSEVGQQQICIEDPSSTSGGDSTISALPCNARVVAQVLQTYMLVEYDGGVILAEQHIADERPIYEDLLRLWRASQFSQLKEPLRLPGLISEEDLFSLESLGFGTELDESGLDSGKAAVYLIRKVPGVLKDLPHSTLGPLLLRLCSEATSIEEAAAAVSCKLAIKNGKPLSIQKLSSIFSNLMRCENPYTCPHGRPIFVNLRASELAKFFERSWLPEQYNSSSKQTGDRGVRPE